MHSFAAVTRVSYWKGFAALAVFALGTVSPRAQPTGGSATNGERSAIAGPQSESRAGGASQLTDANEHLFTAVLNGDPIGVRVALARGAQINARDRRPPGVGETPLIHAALAGDPRVVRLLLAGGAEVNARDAKGDSALLTAAALGHSAIVRMLLGAGADVNAAEHLGLTPLHVAADRGNLALLRLLVNQHGARQSPARNGFTPLMLAAKHRPAAAAFLLSNGARVNARTGSGTTALMVAAISGQLETLRLLLRAGADATLKRRNGSSALTFAMNPLHAGSASGNIVPITRLLLRHGADPGALESMWRGDLARTPLMRVADFYTGYGENGPLLIRMLLAAGADPAVVDDFDRTAYDFILDSHARRYPSRSPPSELVAALQVSGVETARVEVEKLRDILRSHTKHSIDMRREGFEQLLRDGRVSSKRLLHEVCDIVANSLTVPPERDALVADVFQRLLTLTRDQQTETDPAFLRRHCRIDLPMRKFPAIYEIAIDNGFDALSFRFMRGRWPNHARVLRRYLSVHSPALPANRARLIELYMKLARSGSISGVESLFAGGVDPRSVDVNGLGALDHVMRYGFPQSSEELEMFHLLEERGALLRKPEAAMCRAIAVSSNAGFEYLKDRVRSTELKCIQSNGQPLLYELTLKNKSEELALARAAGLRDSTADLFAAIRAGDRPGVRRLLTRGAPVYSPTLLAAFDRFPGLENSPLFERLMYRLRRAPGATRPSWAEGDPSWEAMQSRWGEAPVLIQAIESMQALEAADTHEAEKEPRVIAAMRALLRRGLYPDIVGREYETFSAQQAALFVRSSTDPLRMLLEAGANPNATRPAAFAKYERRPLEFAAISINPEYLRLLLRYGARPSIADRDGHTLLMRVAENALVEQACILRQAGVDPNARRTDGLRAIDLIPKSRKWVSAREFSNRSYPFSDRSAEDLGRLRECVAPP